MALKSTRYEPMRVERWERGKKIHFATGVRTKHYNQFLEGLCYGTQEIDIKHVSDKEQIVMIDGHLLNPDEVEVLAKNDGFDSVTDFFNWFNDFSGYLIHWTGYRYTPKSKMQFRKNDRFG